MNKIRHREEANFEDRFSVGDAIIRYMRKHGSSKSDACNYFAETRKVGIRALMAAHTTASVFPPDQRSSAVGYTKHQSLSEVSRKKFSCSDEDYRRGLQEALVEIARRGITVNVLNSNSEDSAKNLLAKAIRRVQARRVRTGARNQARDIRFPLVQGARSFTSDEVLALQDEA